MADPTSKAASFLSSLKGGGGARSGGLGGLGLGGHGAPPPSPPPEETIRPLARRIDELDKKLAEIAKAVTGPEEGEPPRPPSELMMYIHARTELLERKLQEAQAEALRANILMNEREEAQRRAQKEVEELFRNIQEQQRAARYDAALRDQVSSAQGRIEELERKLNEAKLRALPVEDVHRALTDAQGLEALRKEVEERVRGVRERAGEQAASAEGAAAEAAPRTAHDIASDTGTVLMLTARIADLERHLEEVRKERDEERSRRAKWEMEMIASFTQANERMKKGGVELTIEAALETMSLALKEREDAEAELKDAVEQAQAQPPGAESDPVLRSRITAAQERLAKLQETLQQQLNMVQAWIAQSR